MPAKSAAQRVDELAEKVEQYIPVADFRLDALKQDFNTLKEQVRRLEEVASQLAHLKEQLKKVDELPETSARHDERLKSLEKWHDRAFQIAPMVISAAGVVIALIALFVRK